MSEPKITLITWSGDAEARVEIREPYDPVELAEFCTNLSEAWTDALDDLELTDQLGTDLYNILSEAGKNHTG